mgnify:CR=1 FL=1
MNPTNLNAILDLINRAILIGGELLPVALRAYSALKAESGMSDDQLTEVSRSLNDDAATKLRELIDATEP